MIKTYNFSAGPAMMPTSVLEQAQQELLNWQEQSASVMEVSHRGKAFMTLAAQSIQDLRTLYHIPDNYHILFAQGGARGQFAAVPMNLLSEKGKALYLTSGYWSASAAKEARLFGNIDEINIVEKQAGKTIVNKMDFSEIAEQYDYVHYCPNETIEGIEIFDVPNVGNAVLVADMSSNILSRQIDISKFGVIYAGAQKNLGPSGITLLIVREDLIGKARLTTPSIWNYQILRDNDSMFNTPPTFAWYLCALVFKHLLTIGGIAQVERQNNRKAKALYDYLDRSQLFSNLVAAENRSKMNVVFSTGNPELDTQFIAEAAIKGLQALKGHRIVGGMRASIYNAMPVQGVEALIQFMQEFEQRHHQH